MAKILKAITAKVREQQLSMLISLLTVMVMAFGVFLFLMDEYPRQEFERVDEMTPSMVTIDNLQRFRINGVESSNDWIVQLSDNQFQVTGFLFTSGDFVFGEQVPEPLLLFVPERVSGVTVYHIIPFRKTDNTTYEFLDLPASSSFIDNSLIIETNKPLPSDDGTAMHEGFSPYRLARINFSVFDGLIYADHIEDCWNLVYRYGEFERFVYRIESYNLGDASRVFDEQHLRSQFWLDVSDGESFEMFGSCIGGRFVQIGGNSQAKYPHRLPSGEYMLTYVTVPVNLGVITRMAHVVPVYFLEQRTRFFEGNDLIQPYRVWEISIPVTTTYGVVVFSEHE
ncbi:MAG: hypothetical protein FWD93_03035 [Coriobacteriia bacterium]|nr:hypothetical protein [Coriobacteriia bacterium]